ncbi:radical SAM protein [Sandaracinus amylolyticus]|uniref:Radical SAM domain heme biosynthesis protein n=1 Tax=Sandaracinus amylolyticus TaxID=927083 RepID=A0A0F6YIP6_9BACT|nr:radical SAM protein [Sandaracinus amylolyticus]AKF06976.1 Radical SAM domain heme biosynthesis protein [Sandaracinus amylolyticus]
MQRVGLHLTDRCQLDCDHCLRDPGAQPVDLPLSTIAAVLAEAASEFGIRHVSLTGGEPTLHPELPAILDLAVAYGMRWDMVSNGRRFDRVACWLDEVPARRDACRWIALSLDGASDATHDSLRGAGQRREVLSAASVAVALGVPFGITTTVHARNVDELEAIAEEAEALGAGWVRFGAMQATGTPLDDELRLEPDEWRIVDARVRALRARRSIPVLTTTGWPSADEPGALCGPLRGDTLHVDVHGRLTLCCLHSQVPHQGVDPSVAGDVASGLRLVRGALAEIQRKAILARAADDDAGPWRHHACNSCLRRFGRPHWSVDGRDGPSAERPRWRGALHRVRSAKRSLPVAR